MKLRLCLFLSALLHGATSLAAAASESALLPHGAQSGDLIFRKGTEAMSDLVRSLDSDGEFSHVGLLIAANDLSAELLNGATPSTPHDTSWFVLHATPSEVEGRADSVVLDRLAFFTSPERSMGHAVYIASQTPPRPNATRQ